MSEITLGPIRVLLVDADDVVAERIRSLLPEEDFTVTRSEGATVSARALVADSIDIVVALLCPEPLAPAAKRALTERPVPLVALSEDGGREETLRAFEEDALDNVALDDLTAPLLIRVLRYALERHRLESELRRLAHVDPLTGLHNRRYVMKHLDAAINAARRHRHPLSLCVVDIDHFKQVNDEHGHLVGDEVLVAAGQVLIDGLRSEDVVGRLGGDEFCLLLPHIAAADATTAVERIRHALEALQVRTRSGDTLSISATFGIAELTADHRDSQALFHAADQALYRGKQGGRNRLAAS